MRRDAAAAAALERLVRTALAGRRDGDAAPGELVLLALDERLLLRGVVLRLRDDVDAPAGEPVREPGVQALLADRERELALGNEHRRLAVVVVHVDLAHL